LNPDETVDDFVRQFPHDSVIAGHAGSSPVDDSNDESNRRAARVVMRLFGLTVPAAAIVLYLGAASHRAPSVEAEPMAPPHVQASADRIGVEVTALRACLVTAGVDGQPLVDTRLEAGGRQTFDAQMELMLTVSDPSAIELRLNGQRARLLGSDGVITTVRVTPDNYKTFLATP
jgi:hypothetical protein